MLYFILVVGILVLIKVFLFVYLIKFFVFVFVNFVGLDKGMMIGCGVWVVIFFMIFLVNVLGWVEVLIMIVGWIFFIIVFKFVNLLVLVNFECLWVNGIWLGVNFFVFLNNKFCLFIW